MACAPTRTCSGCRSTGFWPAECDPSVVVRPARASDRPRPPLPGAFEARQCSADPDSSSGPATFQPSPTDLPGALGSNPRTLGRGDDPPATPISGTGPWPCSYFGITGCHPPGEPDYHLTLRLVLRSFGVWPVGTVPGHFHRQVSVRGARRLLTPEEFDAYHRL